MPKRLKIDFFQVEIGNNRRLESFFERIAQMPVDRSRNVPGQDGPFRMQRLAQWNDQFRCWEGDMVKIRLNDPAALAGVHGDLAPVTEDRNKGIGETCAFLYDCDTRVLLYQATKTGIKADKFAFYFSEVLKDPNAVQLLPVIQPLVMAKLQNFRQVKRFKVKIARPDNLEGFRAEASSVGAGLDLAQEFRSPTIEFTLSTKGRGSLNPARVLRAAQELLGLGDRYPECVGTLQASGKVDDEDALDPLDLLKARYFKHKMVEPSNLPDAYYERRKACLREVWTDSRAELSRFFGQGS